jgi:RNA polymerase sigma-70 factor (ECF subfamily)
LYDGLLQIAPTLGARVGAAAATAEAEGPAAARARLDRLAADAVADYQPYWAVRAHVLQRLGDPAADAAFARALALTTDAAVRAFLAARRAADS